MSSNKESEIDKDFWIEISRENIIDNFQLDKYEVLCLIHNYYFENKYVQNPIEFEFDIFENEDSKSFENILEEQLLESESILSNEEITEKNNFVDYFTNTISEIEKIQLIRDWYINGMYAPIIQSVSGIQIDEYCDYIIFNHYKLINEFKNPKNK